ncbi:MAG: sigma factor, partial [Actinomycetota bacterium]
MLEPVGEPEVPTASASSTFEEFFRSTYGRLMGALLLLTGDAAEAEDLAQEALVRVFERWERVQMMDSPEG